MTPAQIRLVQSTMPQIVANQDAIAAVFYARLFELDPGLRPLFAGDMAAQRQKLMAAVATVANGLTRPEQIVPMLQALARRHVGYGVAERHYDTVGTALLWTLERGLGAAFTPERREAWAAAYGLIATTMIAAARQPVAKAS